MAWGWPAPRWAAICAAGGSAPNGRSGGPWGRTRPRLRAGPAPEFPRTRAPGLANGGVLRFRVFVGSFTGAVFIDFLGRLVRDGGGRKIHLIVDGHPVHRAK